MLAGLLFLLASPAQEAMPLAPPLDRVIELELGPGDAVLAGKGPSKRVEHTAEFSGTLYAWTRSEGLDPFLRIEGADGTLVREDDDGGGKPTPCIALEVEPGRALALIVALKEPLDAPRALELHLVAAPESDATRAAADRGRDLVKDADRLREAGEHDRARELLARALEDLLAADGTARSAEAAGALRELGSAAWRLREWKASHDAFTAARRHRERALPADHPDLLLVLMNLAVAVKAQGDLPGARALEERVVAARERTLPADHRDLLMAQGNLARTLKLMGDPWSARELEEQVLAGFERTLAEDDRDLLVALGNLAATRNELGDLAGARSLHERVLELRERSQPEDHPDVLGAREAVALERFETGDLRGACDLQRRVLDDRERLFGDEHPDVLRARQNLALIVAKMGDLEGALALQQGVLDVRERTLPAGHPDLLGARVNVAVVLLDMGEARVAHDLLRRVLDARERTLAPDHPDLLRTRLNLAAAMREIGELSGARELCESVVASYERTMPDDHPELLMARLNLALSMAEAGDLTAARELNERVLAAYERILSGDHPDVLRARMHFAGVLHRMGDLAGALELEEQVVASYERTLPEDHLDLQRARLNRGATLNDMGDHAGARTAFEFVLEHAADPDHPDLLKARLNLGFALAGVGDLPGARAIQERVVAEYERTLPRDRDECLMARANLARTVRTMGDVAGTRALLPGLASGMIDRMLSALFVAPREARELLATEDYRIALVQFLSDFVGPEPQDLLFELVETRRLVASEGGRAASLAAADPELAPLEREAAAARARLGDLVGGAGSGRTSGEALRAELALANARRDRAEREIARALSASGLVTGPVTVEAVAQSLAPGEVAVGYLRSLHLSLDEESGATRIEEDHVHAHVLRSDGALARVDLGPAAELERAVEAWRGALGKSLGRGSGIGALGDEGPSEADAGRALRARLLDPVLAAAGEAARTLLVCPDDLVYLVPLDALPLDGSRIGDRLRVAIDSSLGRLIQTGRAAAREPSDEAGLVALGAVDYSIATAVDRDAEPGGEPPPATFAVSAPIEATLRAAGAAFAALPATADEVDALSVLFQRAFGREPVVLLGDRATKAAVFEHAPRARYLHLATHGWFAPESVRSVLDATVSGSGWRRMSVSELVTGFAPMTVCGLALAGANQGRDAHGSVPGILTAEELCALDLSRCELAVLSACETNVGFRRAGQGIQSLQAALHAAGARTAITSLWKVDDAATRKLMERFYACLWVEKLPKADALWKAKSSLRAEGHPVRDWAAWVLSGDPN